MCSVLLKVSVLKVFSLTQSDCVIDAEAAQDLFHVPCVQESISTHHHLEHLCRTKTSQVNIEHR